MASTRNNNVKLGLFVTIAFLLLSASLYYIGSKQNIFGSTFTLRSSFRNVNGLSQGNSVRYSGINVGTVKDIVIINDTTIEVNMILQKKVQDFVKQDAIARIGSDGLVGNMIINISPGQGNSPKVNDNDIIDSYANLETGDIMNALGATTDNIALLVYNLMEITEQIKDGKGSLSMLINDETLAKDLQLSVNHLRQSSHEINKLSRHLRIDVTKSIEEGDGLLGYLLTDTTFKDQITHISEGLDSLVRQRSRPILLNMEDASVEIARASTQLNNILEQIDLDQGLAYTILKDSITSEEIEQTIHNLDEGMLRFNETMEALQHNFLVRKFFKKKRKVEEKESKNNQ